MPLPLTWALWTLWAFGCAMAIRVTVVRFFKPSLYPVGPYVAAYVTWVVLFAICMALAVLMGFRLHDMEIHGGPRHFGDFLAYFSPFGLPLLAGAPLVLVLDLSMSVSRWFVSPKRRA